MLFKSTESSQWPASKELRDIFNPAQQADLTPWFNPLSYNMQIQVVTHSIISLVGELAHAWISSEAESPRFWQLNTAIIVLPL